MASSYVIAAGASNNIWYLDPQGRIFRWNGSAWSQPGQPTDRASDIAVGPTGAVWAVNPAGQVFQWDAGQNKWLGPDPVAKDVIAITVDADGAVWVVNKHGAVYVKPSGGSWTEKPSPQPAPGGTWIYTVKPNDRLYQIVREQYGVAEHQIQPIVDQIVALNKLPNPNDIDPGQKLIMPPK